MHPHPKILDVTVFVKPDSFLGESVACAVVLRPEVNDFQVEELHEFCKEKLSYYKIPQEMAVLSELPRNPGGKVNKKQVLEHYLSMKSQDKHI